MTLSTKRRLTLAVLFSATSSLAFANAAMGLALEMFEYRTWNPKAPGLKIGSSNDSAPPLGSIWLCRTYLDGIPQGMILDRDTGAIQISFDLKALGVPNALSGR